MPGMTGLSRIVRLGGVVLELLLMIRVVIRLLICGSVVSGSV